MMIEQAQRLLFLQPHHTWQHHLAHVLHLMHTYLFTVKVPCLMLSGCGAREYNAGSPFLMDLHTEYRECSCASTVVGTTDLSM